MKCLLKNNIECLVGKTIEWYAPAYRANEPYTGVCIIKSIDLEKTNPLVVDVISGDNLNYAKLNKWACECDNKPFFFSDEYRYVTFKELN